MKPLKICIVLFVLAGQFFFSSCDNREDYFIDVNKAPTLSLIKNGIALDGNTLSDSLKIGVPLSLQYFIQDEEKIILQVSQEQQKNTFQVDAGLIIFTGVDVEAAIHLQGESKLRIILVIRCISFRHNAYIVRKRC